MLVRNSKRLGSWVEMLFYFGRNISHSHMVSTQLSSSAVEPKGTIEDIQTDSMAGGQQHRIHGHQNLNCTCHKILFFSYWVFFLFLQPFKNVAMILHSWAIGVSGQSALQAALYRIMTM